MVIKLLAQYASKIDGLSRRESLRKLGGPGGQVVVDGDALLYYIYIKHVDWSYGGDNERLRSALLNFGSQMASCGISMLVFVPGAEGFGPEVEMEKGRARVQILGDLCQQFILTPNVTVSRSGRGFRFHPMTRTVFCDALREAGIKFQVTDGPAIPYVVSYAMDTKVPVIAYDSVYLTHDIPCYVHCDSIQFSKEDVFGQVIRPVEIARHLGLSMERYRLGCRILPSDVVGAQAFQPFRDYLVPSAAGSSETRETRAAIVAKLFEFIKEREGKTEDEIFDEVVAISDSTRAQYPARYVPSAGAVVDEFSAQDAQIYTGAALKTLFQSTEKMFAVRDYKTPVSLPPTTSIPGWVLSFLRQGRLPNWALSAALSRLVVLLPGIEDMRSEDGSACLPARPLRCLMYSVLGLPSVAEQLRSGSSWVSQDVEVPPFSRAFAALPDVCKLERAAALAAITKLTAVQRRQAVMRLLLEGDEKMYALLAKHFPFEEQLALPSAGTSSAPRTIGDEEKAMEREKNAQKLHYAFVAGALAYLLKHTSQQPLTPELFAALLTHLFFPVGQTTVARLMSSDAIRRDLPCIHLGVVWQFVVDAALAINHLFGSAFPVQDDALFRGGALLVQYTYERDDKCSYLHKLNQILVSETEVENCNFLQEYRRKKAEGISVNLGKDDLVLVNRDADMERLRRAVRLLVVENPTPQPSLAPLTDGSYFFQEELVEDQASIKEALEAATRYKGVSGGARTYASQMFAGLHSAGK